MSVDKYKKIKQLGEKGKEGTTYLVKTKNNDEIRNQPNFANILGIKETKKILFQLQKIHQIFG